jgi:hypothetical protein
MMVSRVSPEPVFGSFQRLRSRAGCALDADQEVILPDFPVLRAEPRGAVNLRRQPT